MRLWAARPARSLPGDAARQARPPVQVLVTGAAVVLAGILLATGWLLWDARRVAWDHAVQSSANLASTIEHDITRTIELYDLSLQAVLSGLKFPGIEVMPDAMRNEVLFDNAASARYLGPIQVLDENGQVRIDSRHVAPPDENFAERPFFRVHHNDPHAGLYIGTPFKDPTTGTWSIAMSRRIDTPDGGFAGVVLGTLRLDFFGHLFSLINPGPGGSVALFRSDGRLIDRTPYREAEVGRDFAGYGVFQQLAKGGSGVFTTTSFIDGIDRLVAYRQLGKLPLVLTVGTARDAILAPWRRKAIGIALAVLVLAALAGALGAALVRELGRRERAERTARDSERRYRFLAEHSGDMIVRLDPHSGRFTYVSPACRRVCGYEPDEVLALPLGATVHPDDFPGFCAALARLDDNPNPAPIVYRWLRRDDGYVWLEATLTRSQNPDIGEAEIVSVVRDISERIRFEAALRQAKEEADSANRSKSQFLATMSHELRTPLNAIIGFAELMQSEVMGPIGNEHYRSYVSDINVSGSHLLQLINDILDLTKAEAGMLELHEDVIDLAGAIGAVARASRASIEKAGLTIDIALPSDLPPLHADERKVRQVFFNLIGNAVKFTPSGGRIAITGRIDPERGMRVAVADPGIGIAAADLDRVLEPFVQVDSSLARRHHGTGLGLPAVKTIMQLHGGGIELRSTVVAGTEITVVFPSERIVPTPGAEAARPAA